MVTTQDLKQIFLFKDVPDSALKLVAEAAEEVSLSAGESIVSEGQPLKAIYLIRSGTVRGTREGITAAVTFGTGESFGQVPFLDGGPAGLNLAAVEPVSAIVLQSSKVLGKLGAHPEAGFEFFRVIARSLAGRLRRTMDAFSLMRGSDTP